MGKRTGPVYDTFLFTNWVITIGSNFLEISRNFADF